MMKLQNSGDLTIVDDIIGIIEKTKSQLVVQANSALTVMYWHIGKRINTEILQNGRAEYGKEILVTLSRKLTLEFGKSFNEKNLRRMVQFSEIFSDLENVVTLSRHLTWSHFITLIPLKTKEEREFYAQLIIENQLSIRNLRKQISKKVYERIENADLQIQNSPRIEKGFLKDPYLLDFLDLKKGYLENDLESHIKGIGIIFTRIR